jgi:hypothetical protein
LSPAGRPAADRRSAARLSTDRLPDPPFPPVLPVLPVPASVIR